MNYLAMNTKRQDNQDIKRITAKFFKLTEIRGSMLKRESQMR